VWAPYGPSELNSRLTEIAALAAGSAARLVISTPAKQRRPNPEPRTRLWLASSGPDLSATEDLHPAARKILQPSCSVRPRGSSDAGRRRWPASSPAAGISTPADRACARRAVSTRRTIFCRPRAGGRESGGRSAAGAVDRGRASCALVQPPAVTGARDAAPLAAQGGRYDAEELAAMIGKKPSGGHWNSGSRCCATTASSRSTAVAAVAPPNCHGSIVARCKHQNRRCAWPTAEINALTASAWPVRSSRRQSPRSYAPGRR
jgi:hypothetical protein